MRKITLAESATRQAAAYDALDRAILNVAFVRHSHDSGPITFEHAIRCRIERLTDMIAP